MIINMNNNNSNILRPVEHKQIKIATHLSNYHPWTIDKIVLLLDEQI